MLNNFSAKISYYILFVSFSFSTVINVPANQSTIQAGIDEAEEGDTVLVASGTYYENIVWPETNGIKLIGEARETTIIDGDSLASVFTIGNANFTTHIDTTTVISGFTIQNGKYTGG